MMPLHIFHHIPKCAGNSLKIAMLGHFRIVEDYRERFLRDQRYWETPQAFVRRALDLSQISERDLLIGHFDVPGARLWERYPGAPGREIRRIVFLRDPLERAISEFFFARQSGRMEVRGATLEAHLEATENPMAAWLAPDPKDAPSVLAGYWFVGTVETADRDMARLMRVLGGPVATVPVVNGTRRPAYTIGDDLADRFWKRNVIDYALHAAALAEGDAAISTPLDARSS